MNTVLIATKNKGKAKEFEALFSPKGIKVITLLDIENAIDVEETGSTFEENALLKANTISELMNMPVLSDDSGLVIDALDGRPGIFSARYAGPGKDDRANYEKVLNELEGVPKEKRTARFYCAIALVGPKMDPITVSGTCEGIIADAPDGENGFGYDPIFFVPEKQTTMANLEAEEKNRISHRANALKELEKVLNEKVVEFL
ncbi:XTP/dITP diphosphatase [Pradoshia sp. D12]|uniref:XTP/dITP diphosphatase n=1 Tax=Bacillaceae TaxID=186817 RepID=UPI00080ADFBC|nr:MULTISPECIES: XTP/dITP diphosphatase [Bacillaceae]OCA81755.1 non-canonical purine NTP pyrophosphatase [Bacillus sp. FJAT-27986]QFK72425.1 XTP/dITP diphosphatase [Pradoshia sp. D12]TPF70831.1 XTP/dITP diphosphatase [Bacillus sp. D12]